MKVEEMKFNLLLCRCRTNHFPLKSSTLSDFYDYFDFYYYFFYLFFFFNSNLIVILIVISIIDFDFRTECRLE